MRAYFLLKLRYAINILIGIAADAAYSIWSTCCLFYSFWSVLPFSYIFTLSHVSLKHEYRSKDENAQITVFVYFP